MKFFIFRALGSLCKSYLEKKVTLEEKYFFAFKQSDFWPPILLTKLTKATKVKKLAQNIVRHPPSLF